VGELRSRTGGELAWWGEGVTQRLEADTLGKGHGVRLGRLGGEGWCPGVR
jgi:hypothetical protein